MLWVILVGSIFLIFMLIYLDMIGYDLYHNHCRNLYRKVVRAHTKMREDPDHPNWYCGEYVDESEFTDVERKIVSKYNDMRDTFDESKHILWLPMGFLLAVLLVMGGTILGNQLPRYANNEYENWIEEKTSLEYRLSIKEENQIGNELLYNDIVAFNNKLRDYKYNKKSLWTNWWYVQKIADIDYIEYIIEDEGVLNKE